MSQPDVVLAEVQAAHRACRRCVDAGYLERAAPVFSGHAGQRIMAIGQAPGPVEQDSSRPFAGRAGRVLYRWMTQAGFASEDDYRQRVYMTSMTTCFPGRNRNGTGDRRPSAREVALHRPWLDRELDLVRPRLVLLIGTLAQSRFLPGSRLDDVVGIAFAVDGTALARPPALGPVLFPLPHPSGLSRWLNDPGRVDRLHGALEHLRDFVAWAEQPGTGAEAVVHSARP